MGYKQSVNKEKEMSEKTNRFRITSIIIAIAVTILMTVSSLGIMLSISPSVSANPTAITYGGAGTLDALWMNNGLVNWTWVDGHFSFISLYPGHTGWMKQAELRETVNGTQIRSITYASFTTRTSSFYTFTDGYGNGATCKVSYTGGIADQPSIYYHFTLYEDKPLFTWQAKLISNRTFAQNISNEMTTCPGTATGGVKVGPTTASMYYFNPLMTTAGQSYWRGPYSGDDYNPHGASYGRVGVQQAFATSSAEDTSYTWGLLTSNQSAFWSRLQTTLVGDTATGILAFNLWAVCDREDVTQHLAHKMLPGATFWGEKFFGCFLQTDNPNRGFEPYSDYLSMMTYQRPPIEDGVWGSWYEYWVNYNATIMNQTALWLTQNSPEIKYMIFDLGYGISDGTRTVCDSTNINTAKFPNFGSVIDYIHSLGLKAVLWFAPLMGDDLYASHPEYALEPTTTNVGGGTYHFMDYSQSIVRTYITNFTTNMTALYDVDGFKFDFTGPIIPSTNFFKDWNQTIIEMDRLMYSAINSTISVGEYFEICETSQVFSDYANVIRLGPNPTTFSYALICLVWLNNFVYHDRTAQLSPLSFDLVRVAGTTDAQNRTIATIGAMVGVPMSWFDISRNWTNIAKDFIDLSIPKGDLWIVDASRTYTGRTYDLPPRIYLLNSSLFGGSGQYTLGVVNVENTQRTFTVDLTDANPSGLYWAYNVWNESAWVVDSSSFDITLEAYDSALISLTPISSTNVLWSDGKVNSYGAGYVNLDGRYGDEIVIIADTNHIWTDAIMYSTTTDQTVQFTSAIATGTTVNLTALIGTLDVMPDAGMVVSTITTWTSESKKWTSNSGTTNPTVTFTLSGLESGGGILYNVYVDGDRIAQLRPDGAGTISFTYSGPWSEHTFEVKEWTTFSSEIYYLIIILFVIAIISVGLILLSVTKEEFNLNTLIYLIIGFMISGIILTIAVITFWS